MLFAKKFLMGVFFLALPALLLGCEGGNAEQNRRQVIKQGMEKAKRFKEWRESGKKGPPPITPSPEEK